MNSSEKIKKGINTIGLRGINFRSRIEARWAHFFEDLGFEWDYEPFDLDGYIPDFIIRLPDDINNEILVEVKSVTDFKKLIEHKDKIENSGWKGHYLIVGSKLWTINDIMKYKEYKKLSNLFYDNFSEKQRIVIGLFGITVPKFVKENKTYDYRYSEDNYNFIKNINDTKELYVTKDNNEFDWYKFYEKNDKSVPECLLKEINSMDNNEKLIIEILNIEIRFKWRNKIPFIVPNDINKKIEEKDNTISFYNLYTEFNFRKLHYGNNEKLYECLDNDKIIKYNNKIYTLWTNIQNRYQYKGKKLKK